MKVALRSKGEGQNPHQIVEGMWQTDRQTDMFIWSLVQEIVRRLQFPNK